MLVYPSSAPEIGLTVLVLKTTESPKYSHGQEDGWVGRWRKDIAFDQGRAIE